VKSRQAISAKKSRAVFVLETLAEKLPDHILQEYFRDMKPKQARKILTETVALLAPPKDKAAAPRSQATLWKSGKKAWKGQLAGQTLHLFSDGASRGNPVRLGPVLQFWMNREMNLSVQENTWGNVPIMRRSTEPCCSGLISSLSLEPAG
jgi:hypothetical protein